MQGWLAIFAGGGVGGEGWREGKGEGMGSLQNKFCERECCGWELIRCGIGYCVFFPCLDLVLENISLNLLPRVLRRHNQA